MKKADLKLITFKQFVKVTKGFQSRKHLEQINDPSPYVFYLVLKGWLGRPPDRAQSFRDQWHFYILTSHLAIDVYDWKRDSVSAGVYDRNQTSDTQIEAETNEFIALLKEEAAKARKKVNNVRPRAFSFRLVNPFKAFFNDAEHLYNRALSEEKDKNQAELDELTGKDRDILEAALFLYVASFEALLNVIYEIYLRPALRRGALNDHVRRVPILMKLQLAPTFCSCFKADEFSSETQEFIGIKAVFELRNRYIHANITEPMKTPLIREDGIEFQLPDRPYDQHNLPLSPYYFRARHLEFVRDSIVNMVNVIIAGMKPRQRKRFSEALGFPILFLDTKDGGFELSLPVTG